LSIPQSTSIVYIATLDIGSSSARALLYDSEARQVDGFGSHARYEIETTADGGAEIDPEKLAGLVIGCIDQLHGQIKSAGLRVAAVGFSAFWHSFCGIDEEGRPTVPILHLLDTRCADQAPRVPNAHQRTGCVPHASYWPAKLLWLERNRSLAFGATRAWLSFPEYLFGKLFGKPRASISMVSGTGLWNLQAQSYDEETLAALPISRDQLATPDSLDEPADRLLPEYQQRWPAFDGVPWFPAIGDGAASHIGSGCVSPGQFSMMAGTTGAVRALLLSLDRGIPEGLWCYCLDRKRLLMGGALSNGGNVFAWLEKVLKRPPDLKARLAQARPGSHGLRVLPFLAGERSPHWRGDLRGAIAGLSLATDSFQIVQAWLEAVALGFRSIYRILAERLGEPHCVIASGGAFLHEAAWVQMIADAIERPVVLSNVKEASSRGAALFALERLGVQGKIESTPTPAGKTIDSRAEFAAIYGRLALEQIALYERLYEK
jgi:gluconokinase